MAYAAPAQCTMIHCTLECMQHPLVQLCTIAHRLNNDPTKPLCMQKGNDVLNAKQASRADLEHVCQLSIHMHQQLSPKSVQLHRTLLLASLLALSVPHPSLWAA